MLQAREMAAIGVSEEFASNSVLIPVSLLLGLRSSFALGPNLTAAFGALDIDGHTEVGEIG